MQNKIYERNMASLKACFPGLAYRLEEHMYEIEDQVQTEVVPTKDKDYTLKITKSNRVLFTNGKYQPQKEAKKIIQNLGDIKSKGTIFLLGMGNGMLIKELLLQTKEDVNIAVFEPSINIFIEVLNSIDIHEIFEKRVIGLAIEGLNEDEKEGIINSFLTFSNLSYMKKIIHPNYSEIFPNRILNDMKLIQKKISYIIVGENTNLQFTTVMAENLFKNLRYICDSYKADQICSVIPLDIPAIIVAAGPSLNKNIKELKRAKNKSFIIAVDTALKPLIKEGIIPDIFVMIDGLKPIELFKAEGVENIPMIASAVSAYDVFEFHKGMKFYYRESYAYINDIFDKLDIPFRNIPTGGSVANNAFAFAYLSGFSTIILVGQDLALTGNKPYADGTFEETIKTVDTKGAIMVEGNIEPLVPTVINLKIFLDWYNDYLSLVEGVRVINATEGGAKISNTEIMTLKEAIDKECKKEVDIKTCFEKLEPMFGKENREKAVLYFHNTLEMLNGMKRKANSAKKLYFKLDKMGENININKKEYKKLIKKIGKLMVEMEDMPIGEIVLRSLGCANYLVRSEMYEEEESFSEEVKEIARKGIIMMNKLIECIEILTPLVKETVCKIK